MVNPNQTRSRVVSTKLTDRECLELEEAARHLYEMRNISKPTTSEALRYAVNEVAKVLGSHHHAMDKIIGISA